MSKKPFVEKKIESIILSSGIKYATKELEGSIVVKEIKETMERGVLFYDIYNGPDSDIKKKIRFTSTFPMVIIYE